MAKKYKIGIDARMYSDSFTGIGRYTYELTKRFFYASDLPYEWVLFMNEPQFSAFKSPGPHVRAVCVDASHYSFAEQTRFLKILNEENCDLVHFMHFNVPLLYKKPFVVTIHDTTISFYPGKKMGSWWRKIAYQKVITHAVQDAQKIITVSENTKKDVEKLFHISPLKIKTIWNGIGDDFSECSELYKEGVRNKFGLSEKFLLYTGVWREHKNLVRLLEAFHLILQKSNTKYGPTQLQNLDLVITGREDPNYPEIKKTIHRLGLSNHVKLVGLVDIDDLNYLYAAATAYVFPSLYEGFGIPPLEAMRCHTPVCASRTSSIPEVCGDAVEYFDPLNVPDMAETILKVLINPTLQETLIKKGQERIKLFSWDSAAKDILKIYKDQLQ